MKPKISVVTITYNAADCVEMTIKSVLAQTWQNLEYLVIDGASTDGTMKIVERYRSGITTIVSEPDAGIYDAMNKGLKMATGEWIIFLNAADVFDNPEVINNIFSREIEEECSLIFGAITLYSRILGIKHTQPAYIWPQEKGMFPYREQMPGFHQATFYRTRLLKENSYRSDEFKIAGDWASMADILDLKYPYKVTADVVAWYLLGGISDAYTISHLREREIIRQRQYSWASMSKQVISYQVRSLLAKILPRKIFIALRKWQYKKRGFESLTHEDIKYRLFS